MDVPQRHLLSRRFISQHSPLLTMLILFSCSTLLFFTLFSQNSPTVYAQDESEATVIVQFGDTEHVARMVTFTEPISGLRALQWSGLEVITTETNFGPAVCSIEGIGCPVENCFCDANRFWAYSYWDGSAWQGYPVGAGSSIISRTGAVEGWRWGEFGAPQIPATQTMAALAAQQWLQAGQSITDGGYTSVGTSVESMLAIGANHLRAATWQRAANSPSLADFVAARGAAFSHSSAGAAGKLALAIATADSCLPTGAISPQGYYSETLNAYSTQSGNNSLAILGAVALSQTVPTAAHTALAQAQQSDGGWEWGPGWGSDTNATALALQALIASGTAISATEIVSALNYLQGAQQDDGGFAYDQAPNAPSDANSTAYVVQALIAAGETPTDARWTIANKSPIAYLLSLQLTDGSFQWQAGTGTNLLATQQALPALWGWSYPMRHGVAAMCPGLYLPFVIR